MLIIGDHKQTDKKFKYENYPIEENKRPIIKSTKRKLSKLQTDYKQIDYTVWLRSLNADRIKYLKLIGINDKKQLQTLTKMFFHHLPYDVRTNLQTKLRINLAKSWKNLGPNLEKTTRGYHYNEKITSSDNQTDQTASDTIATTA